MRFYLGTHKPKWLADSTVPLFVSRRTLCEMRELPRAAAGWALDSGGFSELQMYGEWVTHPMTYSTEVRKYHDRIGRLDWAAIQDWMCEDIVIKGGVTKRGVRFKGTGFCVKEHQRRTIGSWDLLRQLAPDMPWVPVIQGQHPDDYLDHVRQYKEAGTDLTTLPLVGVGSVCRRQREKEGLEIIGPLADLGIKLHGFGFKVTGLAMGGAALLESADSMAWSYSGRNSPRMEGCTHVWGNRVKDVSKIGQPSNCGNCRRYALAWREDVMESIRAGEKKFRRPIFW